MYNHNTFALKFLYEKLKFLSFFQKITTLYFTSDFTEYSVDYVFLKCYIEDSQILVYTKLVHSFALCIQDVYSKKEKQRCQIMLKELSLSAKKTTLAK